MLSRYGNRALDMVIEELSDVLADYYGRDDCYRYQKKALQPQLKNLINSLYKIGYSNINDIAKELRDHNSVLRAKIEHAILRPNHPFFDGYGMFKGIQRVLAPSLMNQFSKQKEINIWTPNCGRGEETYSVAIEMAYIVGHDFSWTLNIVGTDDDTERLEYAERGLYPRDAIAPEHLLKYETYFKNYTDGDLSIQNNIRKLIHFSYDSIFQHEPVKPYELVIFRGFLKYFTPNFQKRIIDELTRKIKPYGFLVLGVDESLLGLSGSFKVIEGLRAFYQKKL